MCHSEGSEYKVPLYPYLAQGELFSNSLNSWLLYVDTLGLSFNLATHGSFTCFISTETVKDSLIKLFLSLPITVKSL